MRSLIISQLPKGGELEMHKHKLIGCLFTAAAMMLASSAQANSMVMKMSEDPNQWVMPTGDYFNQRYSKLDQINTRNVGDLKVAWTFSTGVLRGHEGSPLVIGDMMYVHTPIPNNIYALDLNNDQKIVWAYEPTLRQPGKTAAGADLNDLAFYMCCDFVNRGLSYADGKIFLYRADAMLVAIDAKTGREVWTADNATDVNGGNSWFEGKGKPGVTGGTGTSAPMVFKDKVFVGISGGEYGVRGHITAYDIRTGKRVWRGYSTGPDSETLMSPKTTELGKSVGKNSGTKTWKSDDQWKIGGGTTWGWYSYDPDLNLMYYGTGNPSTWDPTVRPGDNKWSMTIFARDVDTGQAKWVYQMTPHDEWDYDGINEMILADIPVGGRTRKALVHFDRNGFGYTLDRSSGELLVAEKYDPAVNWAHGVDLKTGLPDRDPKYSTYKKGKGRGVNTTNICPAALGTKDQQPASFSPETKMFYVPTNHVCMDYQPLPGKYVEGNLYVDAKLAMYPPKGDDNMGNFIAWDAGKGKIVWSIPEKFSVWSGALATAGGVVFYGTLEGNLKAVDAKTGKELFRFRTPSGIIGNVMTYMHKGKQYVAVFSGIGGWAGIGMAAGLTDPSAGLGAVGGYAALHDYTRLGGSLMVFSL